MSVFISYSHKDKKWLERLKVHLKPFERISKVKIFSDQDIKVDAHWRDTIRCEIEDAEIAILLVSPDFLASDFITDHELPKLFEGRTRGQKSIITVFVAHTSISLHPEISEFQAINPPNKPLSAISKAESERVLVNVAEEVRKATGSSSKDARITAGITKSLKEVDYSAFAHQRFFDSQIISIPRLVATFGPDNLKGLSFQNCILIGPSVIYCRPAFFTNCTFGCAGSDPGSILLRPVSDWVVGAVDMSYLNLNQCETENIGFVAFNEHFESAIKKSEQKN